MHTSFPTTHKPADVATTASLDAAKAQAAVRAPRLAALAGRTAVRNASGRLILLPTVPHRTA